MLNLVLKNAKEGKYSCAVCRKGLCRMLPFASFAGDRYTRGLVVSELNWMRQEI